MDLSIIVPVYNGEKTIPELYRRIGNALTRSISYEIVFVNDFAKDNSWQVIQELIEADPSEVRGFRLNRNYGQHNAVLYGMTKAYGKLIVTLDEDLQHDPQYIKDLINTQKAGDFDVVYAKFEKLQHPGIRVKTSETLRVFLKVIIPGLYPDYSPYRLIKKEMAEKISILKSSYTFIDGYIGLTTNKISNVTVKHCKRINGESSYSFFKLLKHGALILIAYSKIKTCILFSTLIIGLATIGLNILNQKENNSLTWKVLIFFLSVGILFLILSLFAGMLHRSLLHKNIMPVEFK